MKLFQSLALVFCSLSLAQPASVVSSPHNLSASGPGRIRAASENEVCIFCHTPHNSTPVRPLWNRFMPVDAYSIYSSRALQAKPGQPTGVSKMCLSCHDGTIALGTVVSRNQPIMMSAGVTTIPAGAAHIGTDLRDDHPISFRYDAGLVARDSKLRAPNVLPPQIRLSPGSELQCTSCHDAHNDSFGKFLVMRNDNSDLCKSCHQMGQTTVTAHSNCNACHQPHTAPSGPYLLKRSTISQTCLSCHDGSVVGATNIATDLKKPSIHDTDSPVDPPPPLSSHVSCADCHEPHSMGRGSAPPPGLHPNFGRISGTSGSGSQLTIATSEFEVCLKCHADTSQHKPLVTRVFQNVGVRQQFSPSAVSYHPVEAPGKNGNVPSLLPGWTVGSRVACSSCHGSDTGPSAGGTGPRGIHGSNYIPNLVAHYETRDYTTEDSRAYALCYKCHDRNSILANQSFAGHKMHIVDQRAPCSACHDAHGISSTQGTVRNSSKLMNFATAIVSADPSTGKLEYVDLGISRQQCFLSCHGVSHSPRSYPITGRPGGAIR